MIDKSGRDALPVDCSGNDVTKYEFPIGTGPGATIQNHVICTYVSADLVRFDRYCISMDIAAATRPIVVGISRQFLSPNINFLLATNMIVVSKFSSVSRVRLLCSMFHRARFSDSSNDDIGCRVIFLLKNEYQDRRIVSVQANLLKEVEKTLEERAPEIPVTLYCRA